VVSKELTIRECLDALEHLDAPTLAEARAKADGIVLKYVSLRVREAHRKAIRRAEAKERQVARVRQMMEQG
jgi:hypothetical protein